LEELSRAPQKRSATSDKWRKCDVAYGHDPQRLPGIQSILDFKQVVHKCGVSF